MTPAAKKTFALALAIITAVIGAVLGVLSSQDPSLTPVEVAEKPVVVVDPAPLPAPVAADPLEPKAEVGEAVVEDAKAE